MGIRMSSVLSPRLVLLAPLALVGCGLATPQSEDSGAYSQLHSDSGVEAFKSFAQIVDEMKDLQTRHPELTEIVEYGTSTRGQKLTLLRIQDKTVEVPGKHPAALVSEGIHGNEYLNITDRLYGELIEGTGHAGFRGFLAKGGVVFVVPILNPDGYDSGRRENAQGVDLNRSFPIRGANYPGRAAPETQGIRDFIAGEVATNNVSLEVAMEYHCCIGALITPWAYTRTPPPQDVKDRARLVADAMRQHVGRELRDGTVHQILNYPPTSGGSDDYYLENYGRRAYSYEGRSQGSEPRYFDGHVKWWDAILTQAGTGFPDGT